ncbi:MAG: outer membrane beta-barrel protein [Pedobacter sp.]|uniref:outer membrane beta-barrel protein n=1 Tax=Pedobacter sp. TaxID=1411316 RepID=UPI00280699DF|nr:outer membrane beta-barrel protein [Pedobacter sp.]MDQ8003776.1 outer membrane beta-barrel protein [Pedobacter sp.]
MRYKSLNFSYSPSFREALVSYLQPVANNTNPFFIQNGNPNLRPSKTHQVNMNVYKYDTQKTLSYNLYLGGSVQNDGLIMSRTVSDGGVQTTTPVNQDGIWQFHSNGNLSKEFKGTRKQFTISTGYWGNYNQSYVIVNSVNSKSRIINGGPRVGARINLNDKFEFGETYSFGFNKSYYESDFFRDLNYYNHSSDTEMIIRFPKKVVWETNYRLQHNTQTLNGQNNTMSFWNAAVTFLFLKNDRLQLKCSFNDILNTNNRRYVYITENTARDLRVNNIGRHGLFTLTYNIQNFGGKVGGKDTMFRF